MGKTKQKDPERIRFGTYFGVTAMAAVSCVSAGLMTTWFMQYLTDYAGIGQWAAVLGTTLLLIVRIIDAVNDPLQGSIIDNAKRTKFGKYKPFIFASIICTAIGIAGMFFLPTALTSSPALIVVWVVFFYLLYDIGESWFAPNLIYRTITDDPAKRAKLFIGPRFLSLILGMAMASLIAIVTAVNQSIGDMHVSFGLTVTGMVIPAAIIAVIGLLFVKERAVVAKTLEEKPEKVRFIDFFKVLKENGALRTKVLCDLFNGFIWTFLFATANYYIKWAYCADLSTGAVDSERYGILSLIAAMMMLLPIILGTAIATPVVKAMKSPVRAELLFLLLQAIPCGVLFVCQLLGLLQGSPVIFFICMAVCATAIGANFIPQEVINMESMDYNVYILGKDRSALCNAANKFLAKAQTAVSSALVGAILIAIGYEVDSATDTFVGELTQMPVMLNWFIVVMGLVPFVFGFISWLILRKYPVTDEVREKMHEIRLAAADVSAAQAAIDEGPVVDEKTDEAKPAE